MSNKLLGSSLIIAGTAIGAGMVAMPLTSAQMGFGLTFFLLLALWILLTYTALLYAEVQQHDKIDAGIASLAEKYWGKKGRLFVNFILLFFMYAVLTAYVTGSGDLLFSLLPQTLAPDITIARKIAAFIFAATFGIIVTIGVKLADIANRIAFFAKVLIFMVLLYLLFNQVSISNLQAAPTNNLLFFSALPVFFMTFGFHICTPTIYEYLKGDNKKLRQACIFGSTGIFFIYIVWQLATHGVLPQEKLIEVLNQEPNLNGLIYAFEVSTGSRLLSELVRFFSLAALITSYIGVSLGLSNAVKDLLGYFNWRQDNLTVGLITFVPPIVVGFTYPGIFLSAFAFAGLIFAFIGIILPATLAYQSRKQHERKYQAPGGNIALFVAMFCAVEYCAGLSIFDL